MTDRQNLLDRLIGYVSPRWAAERAYYRAAGFATSYRGAAATRLDSSWSALVPQNARMRERVQREDFRQMRARARQLERDNVLAASLLDRAVENVVGTGLRAQPMTSDERFNEAVDAQWQRWTSGKTADVRHMYTWGHLQRLLYRAKLRDGDAGVLLTEEKDSNGIPHPRIQLIEGEHIDAPYGGIGDTDQVDGVVLNANDAPSAFLLRVFDENNKETSQRVKARDFIFLSRPTLYSGVRGESAFNGGWSLFDSILGYLEATVVAARVGACQALFVKKNNPAATLSGLQGTATGGDGATRKSLPVEPGMINYLAANEEISGFTPTQPTQNFPDAIAAFARFTGLRFGLTLEQILLDFSRTNYSSARAARLQAEQTAYQESDDFAATFFTRVYVWAVAKWMKAGLITLPAPPDWYAMEWIPQGRPWVDPTKEIAAAAQAVALGVDARSFIATERGYNFRKLVKTNEADVKLLAAAGLPTDPSGGPPPAPIVVQPGAANG